jgi:hypothetical protein
MGDQIKALQRNQTFNEFDNVTIIDADEPMSQLGGIYEEDIEGSKLILIILAFNDGYNEASYQKSNTAHSATNRSKSANNQRSQHRSVSINDVMQQEPSSL